MNPPNHEWTTEKGLNQLAKDIHAWAVLKGFYAEGNRNLGEVIALMHSELSEALEAARHSNPPSSHIPDFTGIEEEFADTIIRILDTAGHLGLDLDGALAAKMAFNEGRPYRHGKAF